MAPEYAFNLRRPRVKPCAAPKAGLTLSSDHRGAGFARPGHWWCPLHAV